MQKERSSISADAPLSLVNQAVKPTPWQFSNQVLYDLCREYSKHTDEGVVVAKVLHVGRVYAAAIERRKNSSRKDAKTNDDFYVTCVAPKIVDSKIDLWIDGVRQASLDEADVKKRIIVAHANVTGLFEEISGLEKRSLASKYLHFHAPQLFFIYDSRAAMGMRRVKSLFAKEKIARDSGGDFEYSKFATQCFALRQYCKEKFQIVLDPRQIDNLLLLLSSAF